MKKIYQFLSILATTFGVLPTFAQSNEWKTFENNKCTIEYPASWTVKDESDSYPSLGIEFSILSAKQNDKDSFYENMSFSSETLQDTNISIEEHAIQTEKLLKIVITKYKKISGQKVNSQSNEFYMFEYTGKVGEANLYFLQFSRIKNGLNSILTFVSTKKDYKTFKPTFDTMWQSFKFK